MNGEYMKAMDFDKFYEMAEPYLKEYIKGDYDLKKIAKMVQTRIEIFPDIKGFSVIRMRLTISLAMVTWPPS